MLSKHLPRKITIIHHICTFNPSFGQALRWLGNKLCSRELRFMAGF
jgi:hypothetical protein